MPMRALRIVLMRVAAADSGGAATVEQMEKMATETEAIAFEMVKPEVTL
jgi:hypothetical protein